jgi:hypothetical protein
MRRYLVSMGIRTTCFVLAVVAIATLHWTVIGWILVVAAVVLPYIAVVMANASRSVRGTYLGPVPPGSPIPAQLAPPAHSPSVPAPSVPAPSVPAPSVIDKDRPE